MALNLPPFGRWTLREKAAQRRLAIRWASQMRVLALLLLVPATVLADEAVIFLDSICMHGFAKTTMSRDEASRFCGCVRDEVVSSLTQNQRHIIESVQSELRQGRGPSADRFASSGVRELVVAGQARCEAAFYPPSAPISIKSGALQLMLRCDGETKVPEAFIYGKGVALLSKAEQRAVDERMMKDNFEPEYAKVTTSFDGSPLKTERWEIDLTGQIVTPPNSAQLIERLRTTSNVSVTVERGAKLYSGVFDLRSKIPARWTPCGGVGR